MDLEKLLNSTVCPIGNEKVLLFLLQVDLKLIQKDLGT
jgi:hypothetical protein